MATECVDTAMTPRGELVLRRRGGHYELLLDDVLWLATYDDSAERALVRAALGAVGAPGRVLVSGLGVGSLVRAVLDVGSAVGVTVVEPLAPLVAWNQHFLGTPLDGVRVVDTWTSLAGESFDVILLEDGTEPLDLVAGVLAPGGVAAVWRPVRDVGLQGRVRVGFRRSEELPVPVAGGEPDYLYLLYG